VHSARNAALLAFPFLTISVAVVTYALYVMDFSLAYVADVSSRAMSPFLRLTALWGGQQGSVLFWAWMMAGFVAVVLQRKWARNRDLMPYFIATAMLTTAFFPLINWTWVGGLLLILGTLVAAWPEASGRGAASYVLKPRRLQAQPAVAPYQ